MHMEVLTNDAIVNRIKSYAGRYDIATVVSCAWRKKTYTGFVRGSYLYDMMDKYDRDNFEPIFDIASLTKTIFATALLLAISENNVSLKDKVKKYLPDFSNDEISINDLLSYKVWLDDPQFFKVFESHLSHPYSVTNNEYLSASIRRANWIYVAGKYARYTNLTAQLYIDLIEAITGINAENFVTNRVLMPAKMYDTYFTPVRIPVLHRVVLSERQGKVVGLVEWLQHRLRYNRFNKGYPTDEVSHMLIKKNGILSGMSGLFSTSSDLARFVEFVISSINTRFSPEIQSEIKSRLLNNLDASKRGRDIFVCGFRVKGVRDRIFGNKGECAMGHVGYSGSMISFNPISGNYAVMLSNPNYPVRFNDHLSWHRLPINELRRVFNELIFA